MRTTLGGWVVSISSFLLVLGLLTQEVRVLLLVLPLAVYLTLGVTLRPKSPKLQVERHLSQEESHPGEKVQVTVKVENVGPPIEFLEFKDDLSQELEIVEGSSYLATNLAAGEVREFSYAVEPETRGKYKFGPLRFRGRDLIGFFVFEDHVPITHSLMVAPVAEDLRRVDLGVRRTRMGLGQLPSRSPGPGTEFWSIREYASGDERRRINWKASSRLDSLLTNEYEGERSGDFVLILDAREEAAIGKAKDNALEMGIRATVSLARRLLEDRNRVGLIVMRNVLDWVYPGFGKRQLPRILEALLTTRPGGAWTLGHLPWILSRFFPPRVHLIIISPILDSRTWDAVAEMKVHGHETVVVSPSMIESQGVIAPESKDSDRRSVGVSLMRLEREGNLARLRSLSPVADWRSGEPLSLALKVVDPRQRRR